MSESKTHFEQIPVELVKKIAIELPADEAIGNDAVNVETTDEVRSPQERWRHVAEEVQREEDPQKMIGLVQHLIATLDQEQVRKRPQHTRYAIKQSGDSSQGQ